MSIISWFFGLFGRKEEVGEEKPAKKSVKERIEESAFTKIQGLLLRMKNRLPSVTSAAGVRKERRELEKLRGEYMHLNRKQRRHLRGLFRVNERAIKRLERSIKKTEKLEKREARLKFA